MEPTVPAGRSTPSTPAWRRFVACALAFSTPLQSLPALAAGPDRAAPSADAGLRGLARGADAFDHPAAAPDPSVPLPSAPAVPEAAGAPRADEARWAYYSRRAAAAGRADLASVLDRLARPAGAPPSPEAAALLRQGVRAGAWLWTQDALAPSGAARQASDAWGLLGSVSRPDPAAWRWVERRGRAPWRTSRRAGALRALPELGTLWGFGDADQARAALARAAALPPGTAAGSGAAAPPPAAAKAAPPVPMSSAQAAPPAPPPPSPRLPRAALDKLAQRADLAGSGDRDAIAALDRTVAANADLALPSERGSSGGVESEEMRWASLDALRSLLTKPADPAAQRLNRPALEGTPEEKKIEALVTRMEAASNEANQLMVSRDSAAGLLAAADRNRGLALRNRRSATDMLDLHQNMARLAMVMDLSYSLNVLNSAITAVTGMQNLIAQKLSAIQQQQAISAQAAQQAQNTLNQQNQWKQSAQDSQNQDSQNSTVFGQFADVTQNAVQAITGFRDETRALIAMINARDRDGEWGHNPNPSPDAATEYRRKLALIPALRQGKGAGTAGPSLPSAKELQDDLTLVRNSLQQLQDAAGKLDGVPKEFGAILIALAPPDDKQRTLSNPTIPVIQEILKERRTYYQSQRDTFNGMLTQVQALLDPTPSKTRVDDLGDTIPYSLVAYKQFFQTRMAQGKSRVAQFAPLMDAAVVRMQQLGVSINLPMLSGLSVDQLVQVLPGYANSLQSASISIAATAGTGVNTASFDATFQKLLLARYLPQVADGVILWDEADKAIPTIDKVLSWLPKVHDPLAQAVAGVDAVMRDISTDEQVLATMPWTNLPPSEQQSRGQQILDRKKALLFNVLKPMLVGLQDMIQNVLMPHLGDLSQSSGASSADAYQQLYTARLQLIQSIQSALNTEVPWGLASWGAPSGNAGAAHANIANQRKVFDGFKQQVADYNSQIQRRTDPNGTDTEVVFGEKMPYSLPKRIKQYQGEMAQRVAQINTGDEQLNGILKDLDKATGKTNLAARYPMPTGLVTGAPQTQQALQRVVDTNEIQNLAAELQKIGDDAQKAGGGAGPSLGGAAGGSTLPPTGTQPSPKLTNDQQVALLALEAVKRLVPTTANMGGNSISEGVARYLFSAAVVQASQQALTQQVPLFGPFLKKAAPVLDGAIADLNADDAYVNAPGSYSGDSVYNRKILVYGQLHQVSAEGAQLFQMKINWDKGSGSAATQAASYYQGTAQIYQKSADALAAEQQAAIQYKQTIDAQAKALTDQRTEVTNWLKQLNDPHETAMNRVGQDLTNLMLKTEQVARMQEVYASTKREYDEANANLESRLKEVASERRELSTLLDEDNVRLDDLDPALATRVQNLTLGGSAWLSETPQGQALVVPKAQFSNFLTTLLGDPTTLNGQGAQLYQALLKDPASLAMLLPNSKLLQVGDDPTGYYVVYQSAFGTPGGLYSQNNVMFGNVLRLGNTGVNFGAYKFGSPPSAGNAPYGDQGATVELETLGNHGANYFDVTFHRLLQDGPPDTSVQSEAKSTRMMVFEDFALLLAGDRLYIGGNGYGDWAMSNTQSQPYYLGGNLKSSIKFTDFMSVSAQDQELFASDPRAFLEKINLDFTHWDPSMNQDFVISAKGDQKKFHRSQEAANFNLQDAMQKLDLPKWLQWLGKDTFEVDVYTAQLSGTDDIAQNTAGVRVIKGFSWNVGSLPMQLMMSGSYDDPMTVMNPGNQNTYQMATGQISFSLPKQQVAFTVQGKQYGNSGAYYVEARKQLNANTSVFVGYGSQYVGLNNRLMLGTDTAFTLGQLWRSVMGHAAQDLMGGKALEGYRADLDKFFERQAPDGTLLADLKKVFDNDVGQRLIQLEIGTLSNTLQQLNNAGNILDNTRMRAMVGWASAPVEDTVAGRSVGGGPVVGTMTNVTLTKTQRGLVEEKTAELFAAGLKLQTRYLDLIKEWEQTVGEILQAQWELDLARWSYASNQDPVLRSETEARVFQAQERLHQARVRYNLMTGQPPDAESLSRLNPQDFDALLLEISKMTRDSFRVSKLLRALDPSALPTPKRTFNVMDYIPWVEQLTVGVGAQIQDLLSNQVMGAGGTIRLPLYDKESKGRDKTWALQSAAALQQMRSAYTEYAARAERERLEADGLDERIDLLKEESFASANSLGETLRRYHVPNDQVRREDLWVAEGRWNQAVTSLLDARMRLTLSRAWGRMDDAQSRSGGSLSTGVVNHQPAKDLAQALDQATAASADLEGLALRSQAAAQLAAAAEHRVSKAGIDIYAGVNLTVAGVGWIPGLGATGFPVLPLPWGQLRPEELQTLEARRRGKEKEADDGLRVTMTADLAVQIVTQLSALRAADRSMRIAREELLPQRERAAAGRDPAAMQALAQARAQVSDLTTARDQALASLNFLLGRPPDAEVDLTQSPEELLAQLRSLFAGGPPPVDARRAVLAARVQTARAVEEIVDRNLKIQEYKAEPISLVARSVSRLITAVSGSGDATPEVQAEARNQTLEAQRQQAAYEQQLPAERARVGFQLSAIETELRELAGRQDPESKIRAAGLEEQRLALEAQAVELGVDPRAERDGAALPTSFASLRERLVNAMSAETATQSDWSVEEPGLQGPGNYAGAYGRYYYAREAMDKTPIGQSFAEGWLEFRLKDPSTQQENFLALARLQEERGDAIQQASLSKARAEAETLLARFAARAALLRSAPPSDRSVAEAVQAGLRSDFALIAAHLGLPSTVRLEDLLALVPLAPESDPERLAAREREELERIDWDALKRILFSEGVPDELRSVEGSVSQLRTELIAEKMSFKGFTPVGAVGLFRGRAVAGAFLEAPDPREIEQGLRDILDDALGHQLEARERLHALALRLYGLMASVSDGLRVLQARQDALRVARDNWLGTQVEEARGIAPGRAVVAAQEQADKAWAEFLDTLVQLRMNFVELATDLAALGHGAPASPPSDPSRGPAPLPGAEPAAREQLLDYWTDRMFQADFEHRLDQVFDRSKVAAPAQREALRQAVDVWRFKSRDAETLRASDYTSGDRLRLLGQADVYGRRQAVRQRLEEILKAAGGWPDGTGAGAPGGQELWQFLLKDLQGQADVARGGLDRERTLGNAMRDAFWKASATPPAVQAAYDRLSVLRSGVEERRDALLSAYLEARETPEDFLLRDRQLDAYLDAASAYDKAVVDAFGEPGVAQDRVQAFRLNALFSLSQSSERRRDLLAHGRALLAADVLIQAEAARLDALRYRRSDPDAIARAAQRLAWLKSYKQRLLGAPESLPSLAAELDPSGAVSSWWTRDDVKGFQAAKRLVTAGGDTWLLPVALAGTMAQATVDQLAQAGATRLVLGIDGARDRLVEARDEQRASGGAAADALLATSEFVIVRPDGTAAPLTLRSLREYEAMGKLLYFMRRPDARGLRPFVHPVEARWIDPRDLVVYLDSRPGGPSDRFPTLESLESSGERSRFCLVRTGALGAQALAAEAASQRDRSLSIGWAMMKLDAYGFAVAFSSGSKAPELRSVYMDEKEFSKARKDAADSAPEAPDHDWKFFTSDDILLGLDRDGRIVEVRLKAAGWRRLVGGQTVFRADGTVDRWIDGALAGAQFDREGRIVRAYRSGAELDRDSRSWWFEDMQGRFWPGDGSVISPSARLKTYIDPQTRLPIVLGRSALERSLKVSQGKAKAAKRWAYMPWNWPNLLLQATATGLESTIGEVVTGDDFSRRGYLGKAGMERSEGGATVHDVAGKLLTVGDVIDWLPKPVDRALDPSQLPAEAEAKGGVGPGRSPFEGTPRAGGKDLHLGAEGWQRRVRYAQEDIEEARGRIMAAFQGGVRTAFVETVRGRDGTYAEAKVEHRAGKDAMAQALRELGVRAGPDGRAQIEATPPALAVDRVTGDIQVELGADQHEAERKRCEEWAKELSKPSPEAGVSVDDLQKQLEEAEQERDVARAAQAAVPQAGQAAFATAFPVAPAIQPLLPKP